jgi:ribonuclease J
VRSVSYWRLSTGQAFEPLEVWAIRNDAARRDRGNLGRGDGTAAAGGGGPGVVRVIALGGLGEIGKNMLVVEYGDDMVVIDCGLAFPEEDLPGIDIVLPDMAYVVERKARLGAILLTHGHEDHIGGVPYLLREAPAPVYGSRLTLGMVEGKLAEHGLTLPPGSRPFQEGERLRVGRLRIEPFHVTHSIPGSLGFAVHTPIGTLVFTGDFKFDLTPVDGEVTDFQTLARLGREGVLCLFCDSTNAERPGFTASERQAGQNIARIMAEARGRVLITTFASNVHRIQQVMDSASALGRRVAVVGRSMENTVEIASRLGYLRVPEGLLVGTDAIGRLPPERLVILTTGSQGEPMSALARMASGEYRAVSILPGDTVILAATPVPGNEKMVHRTVDNLHRAGAHVIYQRESGVHVSGHGSREELKLMMTLLRPRCFVPVHGEYRMLVLNAEMAEETGIPPSQVVIGENGSVFELTPEGCRLGARVPVGRILVDGSGVGDVGNVVMRDRRQLAQDGIFVVAVAVDRQTGRVVSGPDITSRGFVYVKESEALLELARSRVQEVVAARSRAGADAAGLRAAVRDAVAQLLWDRTRRRPVVLPLVLEVG